MSKSSTPERPLVMPVRFHRRLSGHLRRNTIAYIALALALSFSPVPSMAVELVGTADIENGAVTAPKLASDSINSAKVLNDSIKAADIKNGAITKDDIVPLEWHKLVLIDGWQVWNDYGAPRTPAWAVDLEGIVHLRGSVTNVADGDNWVAYFTRLPAAARPEHPLVVPSSSAATRGT